MFLLHESLQHRQLKTCFQDKRLRSCAETPLRANMRHLVAAIEHEVTSKQDAVGGSRTACSTVSTPNRWPSDVVNACV